MDLSAPRLPLPLRRIRRGTAADVASRDVGSASAQVAVREPQDDQRRGAESTEPGWRASSYDLKHGLDVVELPTTLPLDVLDRLFNAPAK